MPVRTRNTAVDRQEIQGDPTNKDPTERERERSSRQSLSTNECSHTPTYCLPNTTSKGILNEPPPVLTCKNIPLKKMLHGGVNLEGWHGWNGGGGSFKGRALRL